MGGGRREPFPLKWASGRAEKGEYNHVSKKTAPGM